jgi:hypothetical protein
MSLFLVVKHPYVLIFDFLCPYNGHQPSAIPVLIPFSKFTKNCGTKLLNWRCGLGLEWLPSGPLEYILSTMDLHLDARTFRAGKKLKKNIYQ